MKGLVLGVVLVLSGCALFKGGLTNPLDAALLQAGVDLAVGEAEAKGITSTQINSLGTALSSLTSTTATVASIQSVLVSEIGALKLDAADTVALETLSTLLASAILQSIQSSSSASSTAAEATIVLQTLGQDLVLASALH